MDFDRLTHILHKHFRVIVLGPLLAGLAAFLVSLILPQTYVAESGLAFLKSGALVSLEPRIVTVSDVNATILDQTAQRKAMASLGKSPAIAAAVMAKLGNRLSAPESTPTKILGLIDVTADGDLLRVTAKSDDPQKSALISNTWAQELEALLNSIYGDNPLSASDVQAQANSARGDYEQKQAALVAFLANNQVESLNRQIVQQQQQLTDLLVMGTRLDHLLADAHALEAQLRKSANPTSADELALMLLEANAYSVSANLPVQSAPAGSSPNTYSGASAPFNLQFSVDQFAAVNQAKLASSLAALIATLDERKQVVGSQSIPDQQQALNRLQAQLEQELAKQQGLTRSRDLALTAYTALLNKVNEVTISDHSKTSVVRIVLPAVAPESASGNRLLNTFLAAVVGLLLSIGSVLYVEYKADLVANRPLEQLTNIPVIGTIPDAHTTHAKRPGGAGTAAVTVARADPASIEAFQVLRHRLLALRPSARVYASCSARRQEGRSFVAAQLAGAFVQMGKTVAVVDADFRHPVQHALFGIPNAPGLSEWVSAASWDPARTELPSPLPGLYVVPAGSPVGDPGALLASPNFERFVAQLKTVAEIVIIDVPATLGPADAVVASRVADAILLVVRPENVAARELLQTKEILASTQVPFAGIIVNRDRY